MFLIVKLILFIFKVLVAFALNFFDVDIFIWYPLTPFKTLSLIDILFDAFFFIFLILALLIVALTHFSSDITTVVTLVSSFCCVVTFCVVFSVSFCVSD